MKKYNDIEQLKPLLNEIPLPIIIGVDKKVLFKNQYAKFLKGNLEKIFHEIIDSSGKKVYLKIDNKSYFVKFLNYQLYTIVILFSHEENNLYLRQIYLFSEIFNNIVDGIAVLDENEKNLFVNLTFLKITKFSFVDVIGENINILSYCKVKYPEKYKEIKNSLNKKGLWEGELWFETIKKKLFPIYYKIVVVEGLEKYFIEIINDLTEIKKHKEYQQYLKYYNEFLDIPNENYLKQKIEENFNNNIKFSLILLTLINLKYVNDIFGRVNGDSFLKIFVKRLKIFSKNIFYLGANQFIILLKDIDKQHIKDFINNIRNDFIKNPIVIGKYEIEPQFFCGVYIIEKDQDYNKIFNNLSIAETFSRKKKISIVFYSKKLKDEIYTEYYLINLIKKAIKNNSFILCYQPKITLKDYKVRSAEALIRMKDNEGNIISPGIFIPIAEKYDLIHEIGKWVIKKVVENAEYINSRVKSPLKYSVNVSANQFLKPDFLEIFREVFLKHPKIALNIEIEITEWALMKQEHEAIDKMKKLKEMGFKLVIDDFGTGYSSLAYLKDFPIDYLKIDKIFTEGIPYDEKTVNIVESIIYLGKKLGLDLTAEGVETELQLKWFLEREIEEVQGFYFSEPLYIDNFIEFVKKTNIKYFK